MTASRQPSGKTILAAGRHLRLVSQDGWEFAERAGVTGVVAIVAVTDDGRIVLTEQFRAPIGGRVIDLPAGLAGDVPGGETEELAEAARRELLEETGYEAREIRYLAHGPSSAGMTSEIITFFRAEGLKKVGPGGGEASEDIVVHEVPLERIDGWLRDRMSRGVQVETKLFAGLHLLRCNGERGA